MLEGSRAFDLTWGFGWSAVCFAMAIPTLWWVLPGRVRRVFAPQRDPRMIMQIACGVAGMALACTNALCRAIDHAYLPGAHEAIAFVTISYTVLYGPRIFRAMRLRLPHLAAQANARPADSTC